MNLLGRRFGACVAASLLMSAPALARDAPQSLFSPSVASELDGTIEGIMTANNLPSVAVDVSIPGRGRYVFTRGAADLGTGLRRDERQPFRIASLTKTFVATAVLQLVDRGQLRKADPLAKWYPDFPNADKITIDDLLRMRSGIAAPGDEELAAAVYDNPTAPAPTLAEMMSQAAALAGDFKPPNQEGVYTNLNYDILGGIVQRVTGVDVGAFITENIIKPLGLRQTRYPTEDHLPGGLRGYGFNSGTQQFEDKTELNPALAGPAGAMVSSLADLRRYVRALCVGGLLSPAAQKARLEGQALAGSATEYGEGVITGPSVCGHGGTIPGFSTEMYYVPAWDATLVVSVNRLDRDDTLQTVPVTTAVSNALTKEFGNASQ
jgi:D-alanyl-D-alanine carboxypeptidase